MTDAERQAALDAIASEVAACTRCRLHETRTRAVPGEGSADTEVMFVGEGPGFNEDRQGRPFVGQAGALLTDLLTSVGWARDEVFITNVVKCRPPGNRDPEPDEMAACAPYLMRQLEVLDPALVVTLGRFSMGRFMPGARIGGVHGTYRPADPGSGAPDALAFAMYHPAAALHQGTLKETLFADMQGVPHALVAARRQRAAAAGEEAAETGFAAEPEARYTPETLETPEPAPAAAAASEPPMSAPEPPLEVADAPDRGSEPTPAAIAGDETGVQPDGVEPEPVLAAVAEAERPAATEHLSSPELGGAHGAAPAEPLNEVAGESLAEAAPPTDAAAEPVATAAPLNPFIADPSASAEPPFPVPAPDEPDPQLTLF